MKIYDQRVSKGLSVSSAALLSVVFYLVLDMTLNVIQAFVDPTGESYNTIFGISEFVIVTLYWAIINYLIFSKSGRTGPGAIVTYIILNMLPIVIFTIITSVLIVYFPTTEFTLSWNLLTWIVAPTLFWYVPFSYVYFAFGYYITMPIFMAIILVYILFVQCVGIILGLARRAHLADKENALKRQRERARQQSQPRTQVAFEGTTTTTATRREIPPQGMGPQAVDRMYTGTNPFKEQNADKIIYTESFETVTEDMLRNARQQPEETILMNEKIDNMSQPGVYQSGQEFQNYSGEIYQSDFYEDSQFSGIPSQGPEQVPNSAQPNQPFIDQDFDLFGQLDLSNTGQTFIDFNQPAPFGGQESSQPGYDRSAFTETEFDPKLYSEHSEEDENNS